MGADGWKGCGAMSLIRVKLHTVDGNTWLVDDPEATVEYIMGQLQQKNVGWLPVTGPLPDTMPAGATYIGVSGYLTVDKVVAVMPERAQP
jgi:hypothetical protein